MKIHFPGLKDPSDETMQKFHSQIFQMLNTRLTETFRFYAPLLAALPGFGYVLLGVLRQDVEINYFPSLLDAAYLFSMFLLLIGAFYLLTVSYTYRSLQMVLAGLEEGLGLKNFTPDWDPYPKLKKDSNFKTFGRFIFFWIIPEILKPHLFMFLVAAISVMIAQYAVLKHVLHLIPIGVFEKSILVTWITLFFCISVTVILNGWYLYKVIKLSQEIKRDIHA